MFEPNFFNDTEQISPDGTPIWSAVSMLFVLFIRKFYWSPKQWVTSNEEMGILNFSLECKLRKSFLVDFVSRERYANDTAY